MLAPANTSFDCAEKIWSGPSKESSSSGLSVGQKIFTHLKNNPDYISQIYDTDGVSFTNEEILTMSIRIAQRLKIEEGDIIGLMSLTSTYHAPVVVAAWLTGTVFHPINFSFEEKVVQHLFGISRPKIIFCDAENYHTVVAACGKLNLEPVIYTIDGRVEGVGNVLDLIKPTGLENTFCPQGLRKNEDDLSVILCSSGTTGLPKGVCISHQYLLDMLINLADGGIVYSSSNVDWLSGLLFMLTSVTFNVTRVFTLELYSPQKLRQLIEKYKVTMVVTSGSYMSRFVKSGEAELCDCSSVLMFGVGGGNVSLPMYIKMQDCLKNGLVVNVFGATEFGGVSFNFDIYNAKSVGNLSNGVKARIVDDDGHNLGVEETGEILAWNGRYWGGYYQNPSQTEIMMDSDGWFHTGDLGYFDKNHNLYIVDRKKEIMKYKGFAYSSQEIEDCILGIDGVGEVCVFSTKSDEEEDSATAAVMKKPGSKITAQEIIDHVSQNLPIAQWLHGGVYFVKEIPKTPSGKFLRLKTRDMCLGIAHKNKL